MNDRRRDHPWAEFRGEYAKPHTTQARAFPRVYPGANRSHRALVSTGVPGSEPPPVCRRVDSSRGWSPWDVQSCSPPRSASGRFGWVGSTRASTTRNGPRSARSRPGSGARRDACPGGARRSSNVMVSFIDEHRDTYGVEPICRVVPMLRRPTTRSRPRSAIHRVARLGVVETRRSARSSVVPLGTASTTSTARRRPGRSCVAGASTWRDGRSIVRCAPWACVARLGVVRSRRRWERIWPPVRPISSTATSRWHVRTRLW